MIKQTLGIDIGAENVKIVCLDKSDSLYKLSCCGYYPYKGDVDKLKNFISKSVLPEAAELRVNIEDPSIKIRRLDMPKMDDAELAETVKWALKDVVIGDVDDYVFNYIRIHPDDLKASNKVPLIVYVVKNSALEDRINLVRQLGLPKPVMIEPNIASVASIFDFYTETANVEGRMIMDLGSSVSVFAVIGKNGVLFSRPLGGCSASDLVDQISRNMNVDLKEADNLKNEYFFGKNSEELKTNTVLKNTISQFYSKMAIEVQRSIDGYTLMFGRDNSNNLHMSGGGAYFSGISDYLAKTLGIKVEMFDPFIKIDVSNFESDSFNSKRSLFASACGLAID